MKLEKYHRAAEAGDNEFSIFVNYGVKKKAEGKYKLHRILMVCAYVLFALAFFAFFVSMHMPMFIAILPLLTWILVYFTWYLVSIEYEYTIVGGVIKMMEVHSMRYFRELAEVRLSGASKIAPYDGDHKKDADDPSVVNKIWGVSSADAQDIYYILYENEAGERSAVFFEATEKTLKVIRYYNDQVVMTKTRY